MSPRALISALRSGVSRRDLRAISRASRAAGPTVLVSAWPKLRPLERVAAFRSLDARAAAKAFAALTPDGQWLAYLAEVSEGAAPLLEGARPSEARLLRQMTARERAAMRKALS